MTRNRSDRRRIAITTVIAVLVTAALSGCSGGLPDLGSLDLGSVLEGFAVTTSVDEARAQRVAELTPAVGDDALVQAGTLTVGIKTTESAPLAMTLSDGSQAGIDIDLAYALADELGLSSVEFVSVSTASSGLEAGECDVVMGVEVDEDSGVTVLGDYAQSAIGVFTSSEGGTVPIDAAALSGATVGMQASSVSQSVLEDYDLSVTEQTYVNLNEAFSALDEGVVDYVVCDAYAGAYLATMYDGIGFAGTLDSPVSVGVAVSSEASELSSAVSSALSEVLTNGVADLARARWVEDLPALTEHTCLTGLVEASDEADVAEDDATVTGDTAADTGDAAGSADAADTPAE